MWKIFQEEFYKIASKKIVWIGLFCLLGFVRYRLAMVVDEYTMTTGRETICGKEAIAKDQELTAQYAGPLTEEKVQTIYEKYGFFYINSETREQNGNYCSRFITERMTNSRQLEEPALDDIQFYQGSDWENNAAYLLEDGLRFDYVYGWDDLAETYGIMVIFCLSALFMIGLSSVFSEEYSLKTADILLTTRRGKGGGIWMKAAAAFGFTLSIYFAVTVYVWAIYLNVFGTQGLDASSVMIGWGNRWGYCPDTVAGFLLYQFWLGLAGMILLTAVVLAVSALCKNAFLAVVLSLTLYLIPVVWLKLIGPMRIFGHTVTKAVSHFMASMPVYLTMTWDFGFPAEQVMMHLAIALAVGVAGVWLGYWRYRGYQG